MFPVTKAFDYHRSGDGLLGGMIFKKETVEISASSLSPL